MSEKYKWYFSAAIPFSMLVAVCYLSGYWWAFGIDIFSYINASDLMLSAAVFLVGIGFASGIGVLLGVIHSNKLDSLDYSTVRGKVYKVFSTLFDWSLAGFMVFVLITGGERIWLIAPLSLTMGVLIIIKKTGLLDEFLSEKRHINYVLMFIAVYFPAQAFAYGRLEAVKVLGGTEFKAVSGVTGLQDKDIRYIGKAGTHFFFWEAEGERVHVPATNGSEKFSFRIFEKNTKQ